MNRSHEKYHYPFGRSKRGFRSIAHRDKKRAEFFKGKGSPEEKARAWLEYCGFSEEELAIAKRQKDRINKKSSKKKPQKEPITKTGNTKIRVLPGSKRASRAYSWPARIPPKPKIQPRR